MFVRLKGWESYEEKDKVFSIAEESPVFQSDSGSWGIYPITHSAQLEIYEKMAGYYPAINGGFNLKEAKK